MKKLLSLPNIILLISAIVIFSFVYETIKSSSNDSIKLLSDIEGKYLESTDQLDTSLIKRTSTCKEIEPITITYPKYWKGLDLPVNEYKNIDPLIGEFPSLNDFYFSNIFDNQQRDITEAKILDVLGEEANRFKINIERCSIIDINGTEYLYCNSWDPFKLQTDTYTATECKIRACGDERSIRCLFPDHLSIYQQYTVNSTSYCIVDPDNTLCDKDKFLDYAFNFYKVNLFNF